MDVMQQWLHQRVVVARPYTFEGNETQDGHPWRLRPNPRAVGTVTELVSWGMVTVQFDDGNYVGSREIVTDITCLDMLGLPDMTNREEIERWLEVEE